MSSLRIPQQKEAMMRFWLPYLVINLKSRIRILRLRLATTDPSQARNVIRLCLLVCPQGHGWTREGRVSVLRHLCFVVGGKTGQRAWSFGGNFRSLGSRYVYFWLKENIFDQIQILLLPKRLHLKRKNMEHFIIRSTLVPMDKKSG